MIILGLFVTAALLGMTGIALINAVSMLRLPASAEPAALGSRTSVLVPARNEEAVIGKTVTRLLAQQEQDLEVLVLDDHSGDETATNALAAGRDDRRLQVLAGRDLPEGWFGKNWACFQLGQAASGDILVFTDADVVWTSSALAAVTVLLESQKADLLTVWPTQTTVTWGERLVVPLMALTVVGYLPWLAVHHIPWRVFAAANGQCLAFRRQAYSRIGGHEAVRSSITEDIQFSRLIKGAGLRLRMADGNKVIGCRMYTSWPEVRDGYAKNILSGYGGKIWALLLATVFHWLVFLGPWVWLASGWLSDSGTNTRTGWPWWPLALAALGFLVRGLTAALTHQRVLPDALLMPMSVLLMTAIAGKALWWQVRYGGPAWKGRVLTTGTELRHG